MNSENNNKDLHNAESSVFEKKDYEMNISEMFMVVVSKIWILILAGLIAAVGAFFYTTEFISPTYRSTARVYILNRQSSTGTSMNDLNSAATLKNDFVVLIKSRNVYKEVLCCVACFVSYNYNVFCSI